MYTSSVLEFWQTAFLIFIYITFEKTSNHSSLADNLRPDFAIVPFITLDYSLLLVPV